MPPLHLTVLNPGLDTFLYAVPALSLLLASIFRLDELLATPKQPCRMRRLPSGTDENGRPLLCDPDGRRYYPRKNQK